MNKRIKMREKFFLVTTTYAAEKTLKCAVKRLLLGPAAQ